MKKIKFRAWDKTAKEMREVVGIDFQYQVIGYLFSEWYEDFASLDFSEIELMQFTGLKDKNGVEIYEGDIVCMHNFYGGFDDKIDVIGIVGIDEMGTYTETEDDKLFWLNYWVEPEEEFEVIGNVWEQPELLEEK